MTPGILSAMTDGGWTLPVIDVTNPAFAVTTTDTELAAMCDQFVLESKERQEMPAPLRDALQRSMLGRALFAASGTFLTGMDTYLLKLGPDNLGAEASPIDRRIAASFPALMARVRLQDMARLLADGVSLTAAADPHRPLCLVNIGGGPAGDSWNALIHLHAAQPDLLAGREIVVTVLDLDDQGPAFGVRAFEALRAPGAPLRGLAIGVRHVRCQWSDVDRLRNSLQKGRSSNTARTRRSSRTWRCSTPEPRPMRSWWDRSRGMANPSVHCTPPIDPPPARARARHSDRWPNRQDGACSTSSSDRSATTSVS